ncbi:hypothetical protein T01_8861 [Trichinella spiralis]|uniref:Secreted protein n=1 Tax=Trichinella spiralis TaxID=6334 RepID=A0A0V1B732_TRISP|nr:hypothetical protein T01_8861 [Trichinella spiralis]
MALKKSRILIGCVFSLPSLYSLCSQRSSVAPPSPLYPTICTAFVINQQMEKEIKFQAVLLRHLVHATVPPFHMVVGFTEPHHAHSKVKYWSLKGASAESTRTRLELTSQHLRFKNRWVQGALAET